MIYTHVVKELRNPMPLQRRLAAARPSHFPGAAFVLAPIADGREPQRVVVRIDADEAVAGREVLRPQRAEQLRIGYATGFLQSAVLHRCDRALPRAAVDHDRGERVRDR